MAKKPETKLRRLFEAAVERAHPDRCMTDLPWPQHRNRTYVVGAGKAAAAMAVAVERHEYPVTSGLVVVQRGARLTTERIEIVEANHPIPDQAGVDATERILNLATSLEKDDALVVLLSGGGSSLLCAPRPPFALADKQDITQHLLRSGAAIDEINCVRKHLSKVKGGQLAAAAYPAQCLTFAVSDVAGDDAATIASGPTVPDPTTIEDAKNILRHYEISEWVTMFEALNYETPKPDDQQLSRQAFHLIATPMDALEAAAQEARKLGLRPQILSDRLEGSTEELAQAHARRIGEEVDAVRQSGQPIVLLSGGEATVQLSQHGGNNPRGGPNQDFALRLARALDGMPGVFAIAADTDGRDGNADAAGAFISPNTLHLAEQNGLSVEQAINNHASTDFFEALGASLVTGPTHTNVNDFRAVLIDPTETTCYQ